MFRRFQKGNSPQTNSDFERVNVKDSPENDSLLIKVIGVVNVERWNNLKSILNCKTNCEFATRLLDIAQQFLNRKTEESPNELQNGLKEEKKKKQKNKTNRDDRIFQLDQDKNIENAVSEISVKLKTNDKQSQQTNDNSRNSCDLILIGNDQEVTPESQNSKVGQHVTTPMVKNSSYSNLLENEIKTEKQEDIELEKSSSLDVIKIRLCHYCNTHHIQDHCPINLPQYNIFDNITLDLWKQNYKALYDNFWKNVKKENHKADMCEREMVKYSYALVSLPDCLRLADTNTDHGLGVFAKTEIECFTQMGPLVGKIVKEMDISEDFNMKYLWEANLANGHIYFNMEDNETSNWTKFIRPAPTRGNKNLTVIVKDTQLYFVSVKVIKVGEELFYWQDTQYQYHQVKKKMEKTTCGGCNIYFSHPHYYRTHCSVFHDIRYSLTIKKYHCKVCGEAVLGKENIMKHAAELHNGQGAYQCQFCKKFFLRLNYLEMHRTYGCSANPHRSRPLCDFCGKKFCQPQKLKIHIKRMHSDISEVLREFQCKNCMKILGSRAALQRHAKEVHQKQTEGQWSCGRCGKKFQNKSNLKIHMLTHSGIKPFKCSAKECKSAFTTKQCLQFHYKKVHNYTDDTMPKIERSIDYTFQAYSGDGGGSGGSGGDDAANEEDKQKIKEYGQHRRNNGEDSDDSSDSQIDEPMPVEVSPREEEDEEEEEEQECREERSPSTSPVAALPVSPHPPLPPTPLENVAGMKVLSKGSKKWIADNESNHEQLQQQHKLNDLYPTTGAIAVDRFAREPIINVTLQESEFGRHHESSVTAASNASLLVEAALDSVCQEPALPPPPLPLPPPSLDSGIGGVSHPDALVGSLYGLAHVGHLSYAAAAEAEAREINLMSPPPPGNDHISVTDDLNEKLHRHAADATIGMHYSEFHHNDFSPPPPPPPHSPDVNRSNFVRNYINSLSPAHNMVYQPQSQHHQPQKSLSPEPASSRYADHFSSDDSNGMAVQNLSLHPNKSEMQLDLSIYKSYKASQDYMKKLTFEHKTDILEQDHIEVDQPMMMSDSEKKCENQEHGKYSEELSLDIRSKFDIDLDMRLKSYEAMERNHIYEGSEVDFRSKGYDMCDVMESRNKQYELESDFVRTPERAFEPLMLNTSELQGLDMSARSGFHSYAAAAAVAAAAAANIGRYHHLYPEMDRVDLRLNYSPPPPGGAVACPTPAAAPPPPSAYSHAELLRVVSLDLSGGGGTPGMSSAAGGGTTVAASVGRHSSVDLSLRSHPAFHQIAAARILEQHQGRLLGTTSDLTASTARHHLTLSDAVAATRLLTDHTASRILNEPSVNAAAPDDSSSSRLLSDQSVRLLDHQQQSRLISESARAGGGGVGGGNNNSSNSSSSNNLQTVSVTSSCGGAASSLAIATSPSQSMTFGGFASAVAVPQSPYHPTPLAPPSRPHLSASPPPPTPYHYPAYY